MTFEKQCRECHETKDERIDYHWIGSMHKSDSTCKKCRNAKALVYYVRSRGKRSFSGVNDLKKHRHKFANHMFKT